MITFWYSWHFLAAKILQCFWNRSCCASFFQQLGSKAAARCAAGGLQLPELLGTTAAPCILLLHHRGVSVLYSDTALGSRDGFQTVCLSWTLWIGGNLWHYWRFWDYSSEDQKGLFWECGCGGHQELLLEDMLSLWQQARLFPQTATGAWWPPEAEILAQTSKDSWGSWTMWRELIHSWGVLWSNEMYCLRACGWYVSSLIFFFFPFNF